MSKKQMTGGKYEPAEAKMRQMLGPKAKLWSVLRKYLADHYPECVPVFTIEGKDKSYTIRYRKSGKTLVTLYPASKSLIVLVVLGKKEIAKVETFESKLSKKIRDLFRNTKQYHDGRWLWIKPSIPKDIESIKALLSTKRRPKHCEVG